MQFQKSDLDSKPTAHETSHCSVRYALWTSW